MTLLVREVLLEVWFRYNVVCSVLRGGSTTDSLRLSGVDFRVICVSNTIHQLSRTSEETSSVALLEK